MDTALKALLSEIDKLKNEIAFWPEVASRHSPEEVKLLKKYAGRLSEKLAQLQWVLAQTQTNETLEIETDTPPLIDEAPKQSESELEVTEANEILVAAEIKSEIPDADAENKIYNQDISVSERLMLQPIADLRRAFGINERFFYTNELFDGDGEEFSRAINEFNHLSVYEDAIKLIASKYQELYHWSDEDENVQSFLALIRRRYL
jgi:hypothetical protein